ncbi:MAG: glycosyltransferase [Patescibacteria group bacterium]
MRTIKTKKLQNTALLFILLAPFTILYYAVYVFNPVNAGNIYLYILQIVADFIAIVVLGTLWLTILLDLILPEYHKREYRYKKAWIEENKLRVGVFIPVANEPIEIIRKTVINAVKMDYLHETCILDDGKSAEVEAFAKEVGAFYIARPAHAKGYAKSGNLNYGLKFFHGEFFAVFDADHIPKKTFLTELLPFFENEKVALVQTPQHFVNTHSFIASGTAQAQDVFYKYVQPAKNSSNASFCVGTNMIYRKSSIEAIGGIAKVNHSEDVWTTIMLHEKGFESIFYNKILAEGIAPETINAFFRQQNRWARGGFSLFFTHNPLFVSGLTSDQKLQYFFSNLHYFGAFSVLIYITLPIFYLLFGLHPMNLSHGNIWLEHYVPYFLTVYFLPIFLLGSLRLSTISTSMASFYPYIKAFFSVVLKNHYTWVATESKRKSLSVIMTDIWPHVFIIILSLLSVLVGWFNPVDIVTTSITTFWVLMNAYFLFAFIKNGLTE